MISAKEKEIILVKMAENENLNDLQSLIEAYEIDSAIVRGFGQVKVVEAENKIANGGQAIIEGVVSSLDGKPYIDIYCHIGGFTGKVKNLVANDIFLTIKCFHEIKLISRKNEKGKLQLAMSNEDLDVKSKTSEPAKEISKAPEQPADPA